MIILIIVLNAILLIAGIGIIVYTVNDDVNILKLLIGILLLIFSSFIFGAIPSKLSIAPIDVYRGRTSLLIEEKVINGVVVSRDSTVVIKGHEKK